MIDALLQAGLSNARFALVLAILATLVGSKIRWPQFSHLLWVLVLVKLISPPLWTVPIELPGNSAAIETPALEGPLAPGDFAPGDFAPSTARVAGVISTPPVDFEEPKLDPSRWTTALWWVGLIWLAGSCLIIVWSLWRVWYFHKLLTRNIETAPESVQQLAISLADRLRVTQPIKLSVTSAQLAPMVWWIGGRVHVVLPKSMFEHLPQEQRPRPTSKPLAASLRRSRRCTPMDGKREPFDWGGAWRGIPHIHEDFGWALAISVMHWSS
jgi:bla regulator protein BlaR1